MDQTAAAGPPPGGWFRRVFESELKIEGSRSIMTSIYYLLEGGDFSALHRLKQDEQWHYYNESPITIHEIGSSGIYTATILGVEGFQYTVRAGNLFGATVEKGYALVGCTVVPGFDFTDFELPPCAGLLRDYPQHAGLITRLTRPESMD